jgi:trypsin-like peptidase
MHREFFRYAIPFTFGNRPTRNETPDLHLGTCVAVHFPEIGSQFLVTARHVLEPAIAAVSGGADCLAGNVQIVVSPTTARLSDEPRDVGIVSIDRATVAALEADGYLIFRPPEWPPLPLAMSDPILAAGFPSAGRQQVSRDALDLNGTTKLGLIHHLRETEFVCQLDPAFVDEHTTERGAELSAEDLPGLSGGPAILVRRETILVPRLCGILKQGVVFEGGTRLLYFARLDSVGKDGTIQG